MLLLFNNNEACLQAIKLTLYSNCYLIISNNPNICYLIKFFIKKLVFYKQLKRNANKPKLFNFFANNSILLLKKILLANYINSF